MAKFPVLPNVAMTLRVWATNLLGLRLDENLIGYEWTGVIAPGAEAKITHGLGFVPTRFLVLSARGTNLIVESDVNRHTLEFFYLKNLATTSTFDGRILILP